MENTIDRQVLLKHLRESWISCVSQDCDDGYMWSGENCVTASLSFHLRNAIPEEWKTLRFWYECSFPRLNGLRKGRVDMVVADAEESICGTFPDYWDTILDGDDGVIKGLKEYGILLAIEVKYANWNWKSDFKRLARLQKKTPYHITPVFAYVEATRTSENMPSQYHAMKTEAEKNKIVLLFGDPHTPKAWTFDDYSSP